MPSRTPALGRRGEGWVLLQLLLFAAIAGAGLVSLGQAAWSGGWGLGAVVVGGLMIVAGGSLASAAAASLRTSLSPFPRPVDDNVLVETGVYRFIRHPIYAGIVLAGLGWGLVAASPIALALVLVLLALFDAKSRREEAWLAERHPEYASYRARTRRFIPRVY